MPSQPRAGAGTWSIRLRRHPKSRGTTLRCLGLAIAKNHPVLYVNFEQLGRNVFAKLYQQQFHVSLRQEVHENTNQSFENVLKMPNHDLYLAFWTDKLQNKSFNMGVRERLKAEVDILRAADKEKRMPVIIMENLTDIYNERMNGQDNVTNMVTQTAQDIKNFCIENEMSIFLAHHSGKLARGQKRPSMDDARDSKRVCDLAHSIFTAFKREDVDQKTGEVMATSYHLAYLAGRGSGEYKEWDVSVKGLEMTLK